MNQRLARLQSVLEECSRHAAYIECAREDIFNLGEINAKTIEKLTRDDVRNIDQFAFRFTRLHDALGRRLFPVILEASGEPLLDEVTFIDKLNALEKLGAIESAAGWEKLRAMRNMLTHEYPDAERRAEVLRDALSTAVELLNCYRQAAAFAERKFGIHLSTQ